MIELATLLLLFGALLYRCSLGLPIIGIISALTSAFFFINFLSRKAFWYGLLFGILIFAGAWTMALRTENVSQSFFGRETFSVVIQSVDRRLDKTILIAQDRQYKKLVQVTIDMQSSLLPGDVVRVFGTITQAQDFMTDTGRLFPYKNYLQSKGIMGLVSHASVTIISKGRFSIIRVGTILRFYIADVFSKYIAFPIDGIASGVVAGYQGGIPEYVQGLFRTTGVLHVLVLSGENITLLVVFLSIVLRALPFKLRTILTGLAIVLVVIISGSGVSAIRAGIMGGIALSAGLLRRGYVPFRALVISVLFFFFYSPQTIFVDPGFHLSFLASLFMIVVLPKIKTLFHFLPEQYKIREVSILAVCVPLFMLPYTMYFSGLVPLASPFANILMVVVTPLLMLAGASMLAVSWFVTLAQLCGIVVSYIGIVAIDILKVLNTLPQLNTPPLAWWGVIASYTLFFGIVFRKEITQFWFELQNSFLPQTSSSAPRNQ